MQAIDVEELIVDDLVINLASYEVAVGGQGIDVTFQEFEILRRLSSDPGRIIDYDSLCEAVWSSRGPSEKRRLLVAVCHLRAKLEGLSRYQIDNVRGRGYGLIRQP